MADKEKRKSFNDTLIAMAPPAITQQVSFNNPYAVQGPYQTTLHPVDELRFRDWVKQNNIPFDPDDPKSDYDMRGFYLAQKSGEMQRAIFGNMHFPDTYKTPYHQTFSNESKYSTPIAPHWQGNKLLNVLGGIMFDESK